VAAAHAPRPEAIGHNAAAERCRRAADPEGERKRRPDFGGMLTSVPLSAG